MRGRKPTPTVFKLLRGNPGKRALNANEPEIPALTNNPPAFLTKEGREEWDRILARVGGSGMLTEADRAALTVYCVAWGRVARAEVSVGQVGELVKSESGYPVRNPMLRIAKDWVQILAKMCPELGLTPSSRSRVAVPKKDAPTKLARLAGKNYGGGA